VHLVLSATEAGGHLQDCAVAFQAAGANRLAMTRLDEAGRLGHLISLVRCDALAWSYVSSGQNFKADLQPANLRPLLPRMLGGQVADMSADERVPCVMSLSAWSQDAAEASESDRFF